MIKGIYADEADKLHPEQWVNVYHIDFNSRRASGAIAPTQPLRKFSSIKLAIIKLAIF
jgi:hypothetical protein